MSHGHPLRCREKSVLRTSRMSTVRGCPPRGLCLAGGISGAMMAHCSSVRSEGYCFRAWSFFFIRAHSSAGEMCANSLTNILFCQALFPDSLSVAIEVPRGALVAGLIERGFPVFAMNPKQLERFRDRHRVAGAKDDRRDALVLADSMRTDQPSFRRLQLDAPQLLVLRELSRAEETPHSTRFSGGAPTPFVIPC